MSITIGLGTRTLTCAVTAIILGLIAQHATAQTIQGTAAYRERMAMPAGAVFEATLEDVSRVYAPASAIASTRLAAPGNPPIEFSIAYDPAKIVANNRYVVRARIAKDGKLLFTSDATIPVITRGNPISVSIMLRRAADSQAVSPDPAGKKTLEGTYWKATELVGRPTPTPEADREAHLLFQPARRLSGSDGCNRFTGGYQLLGDAITFGQMAGPAQSMHDQIVKQWANIRSYVIKDGHLFLSLMADGGIYEFEPIKKGSR